MNLGIQSVHLLKDVSQWYNDYVAKKWVPAADTPPPPSEIRPHAAAAAFSAAPTSEVESQRRIVSSSCSQLRRPPTSTAHIVDILTVSTTIC